MSLEMNFYLVDKKLKEIFGNDKVSLIGNNEIYLIENVCKIDIAKNIELIEILKKYNIKFKDCKIDNLIIDDFKNIIFEKCEINTFKVGGYKGDKKERLEFIECILNKFCINGAGFEKFICQNCEIFGKFLAKDCVFENADFSNTIFQNESYFNNSKFEYFVDFHEAIFKNVVYFYGVNFNKTPNFSSVIFNEKAILINVNFKSHSFDSIKKDCDNEANRRFQEWKNNNTNANNKKIQIEKENIFKKTYSDFRNSFSIIKTKLNNSGNLIDASNHHKAELYCKEMELEYNLLEHNYKKQQNVIPKHIEKVKEKNIIRYLKSILYVLKNAAIFLFNFVLKSVLFVKYVLVLPIFFVAYLLRSFVLMLNDVLNYLFSTDECIWKRRFFIKITVASHLK